MTKNPGRPTLSDEEPTVRINAKVPSSVRDIIKAIGEGNISEGVRRMVELFKTLPVGDDSIREKGASK